MIVNEEDRKAKNIARLKQQEAEMPKPGDTAVNVKAAASATPTTTSKMGAGLGAAAQASSAAGGGGAVTGALSGGAAGASIGGPLGAAIGAGVGGIAGLLSDRKKKEDERRARVLQGLKAKMEGEQRAAQMLQSGTQSAFNMMLAGQGKALS